MNNVQKAILIRELKHAAGILAVGLLLCVVMGLLTLQPILSIKKLLIITSAYLTFCFVRLQLLLFYGTDRLVPFYRTPSRGDTLDSVCTPARARRNPELLPVLK